MPKKPFTAEEVAAQCERIMDSAATVMADVGFHHLSMRKLAAQLGMTASNIYNYFPDKEVLFVQTRRRGFELAFIGLNQQMTMAKEPIEALCDFASYVIAFAQRYPGYYQLMFQPPRLSLAETGNVDQELQLQVERQTEEWQRHLLSLLNDAVPGLLQRPITIQTQTALFFFASLHGLIDAYRHRSLPLLLEGVDLIPDAVIQSHLRGLLALLKQQVIAA